MFQASGETGRSNGYGSEANTYAKFHMKAKPIDPKGLQMGKQLIRSIGNMFKFREDMIDYATDLFCKVYQEKLLRGKIETKKALCACCIYITARDNDYGITVRDISKFLDMKKGVQRFGAMLKLLKSEYNVSVKEVGPGLEAYNLLSKAGFPVDLIKVSQRILELLQQLWIVTGKSRTLVIIASAYFAWKCKDIVNNRNVGIKKFCKLFNFTFGKPVRDRKNEMYDVLKKLALQIPWVKTNDKNINVEYYLNDILEFQQGLQQQAISAAVAEFRDQMEPGKGGLDNKEELGPFLPPSFKESKLKVEDDSVEQTKSSARKEDLPQMYSRNKPKDMFASDDDEYWHDLGSEDDTDDYIITEEEFRCCKAKYLQETESK